MDRRHLALIFVAGAVVGYPLTAGGAPGPNVVIISIDGLSASHLPCYGYHRDTAPNICEFGEENIFYDHVIAESGWTTPAVSALFTGQFPAASGVVTRNDTLSDNVTTIAERFYAEGYTTIAYPGIGEGASYGQPIPEYNLHQGFEEYRAGWYLSDSLPSAKDVIADDDRFFLYLHGHDVLEYYNVWKDAEWAIEDVPGYAPETNYSGPLHDRDVVSLLGDGRGLRSRIVNESGTVVIQADNRTIPLDEADLQHFTDHYDARIQGVDRLVDGFLDSLREEGVYDETVVVVVGPHGESLVDDIAGTDRVISHGALTDDVLRVPLFVHVPDGMEADVEEIVQLSDVTATVLDLAGIDHTDRDVQGRSTLPLMHDGYVGSLLRLRDRLLRPAGLGSDHWDYAFSQGVDREEVAVSSPGWRYTRYRGGGTTLFTGKNGSMEPIPADRYPDIVDRHADVLERWELWNRRVRYGER